MALQAMSGHFDNVPHLIDLELSTDDVHLGTAAARVFCHTASRALLPEVGRLFSHPNPDVRVESYAACFFANDFAVIDSLLTAFPTRLGDERNYTATAMWDLIDASREGENALIERVDDTEDFLRAAHSMAEHLAEKVGLQTAILHGEPLAIPRLIEEIELLHPIELGA